MARHLSLPVRGRMNLTDPAKDCLHALNGRHGRGNDYLRVVSRERLDDYADGVRLDAVFSDIIEEYGAPAAMGRETNG